MSNPFDMGALGGLLGNFQEKLDEMKRKAASTEVEGTAGGGAVKVTMTCDFQVTRIEISEEVAQDRELVEDLVRAGVNEASRLARAEMERNMQELAGGLPIPPGLLGM